MQPEPMLSKRMPPSHEDADPSADSRSSAAIQGQQLSILGHDVQFYEDEAFLIETVKAFVTEGLRGNEQVVLFATPEHQQALKHALQEELQDTEDPCERTVAILFMDAGDVLAKVMVNEWPDEALFMGTVGEFLKPLSQERPLRVFGEMVALLWAQQKHRAALRLEELWNKLIEHQPLSLLCAYCITGFHGKTSCESYQQVCRLHRQVHLTEKAA